MAELSFDIADWAQDLIRDGEAEIKKQGLRPMGYFCSYVPEEIMSVGGLYPYRLRAPNNITTEIADSYLGVFNCSYTRCMLEIVLDKDPDWLEGYIFTASCDHLRRLYDNFRYAVKPEFIHMLDLPNKSHEDACAWYTEELAMLKASLEKHLSITISNDDLRQAIMESNENRRLISQLNELRKKDNPPLSGRDMQHILTISFSLPKSIVNPALSKLLEQLREVESSRSYRARVLLMGSHMDDPEYIGVIEERGALVVADGFCVGSIHYINPVPEDGDPLAMLAERYLSKVPCPRMFADYDVRLAGVKQVVDDFRVQGIIIESMKFCDVWGIEANVFLNNLRDQGYQVLRLEREYALTGVGQLRTRVQAFLESMGC